MMKHLLLYLIRLIVFVALIVSIGLLISTFYLWIVSEGGIEPINAFLNLCVSTLSGFFAYLLQRRTAEATDQVPSLRDRLEQERDRLIVERLANDRQALLKKVHAAWVEGDLEGSLSAELHAIVHQSDFTQPTNLGNLLLQTPNKAERLLLPGTNIFTVFENNGRNLLILGEPGSGKTTALRQLTEQLIQRAERYQQHPIPVYLVLASWAKHQGSFAMWVVNEISIQYKVPPRIAEKWLATDGLILLLDGLDEVDTKRREACVLAIEKFRSEHMIGTAICSRKDDYEILKSRFDSISTIVQLPLTPEQIDDYLKRFGQQLEAARIAIAVDRGLQEFARTPLILNLIALLYRNMPISDLKPGTLQTRRSRIFARYISFRLERRHRNSLIDAKLTERLLTWLAIQMSNHQQTQFLIEQMQYVWLSNDRLTQVYRFAVQLVIWGPALVFWGLACGLTLGLLSANPIVGVMTGLLYGLMAGLGMWIAMTADYSPFNRRLMGLVTGLTVTVTGWSFVEHLLLNIILGILTGVVVTLTFRRIGHAAVANPRASESIFRIVPHDYRLGWSWRTGIYGFADRFMVGAVIGSSAGIVASLAFDQTYGILVGIALCMIVAVAGAISFGMITVDIAAKAIPNEGTRRSLENALRYGSVSGLILGVPIASLVSFHTDEIGGIISGAAFCIAGFTIAASISGGFSALQHLILRILLRLDADVPLRLSRFLDSAVADGLLQRRGGGYVFYHTLLLHHFVESASVKLEQSRKSG